jgi:hypothetical protein
VRKIGPHAHRAKLQVMTAITSVCSVKAWAGSLLAAASKEIREAHPAESAPFSHLPEKFSQPFVELRLVFYYNFPIPQNK